MEGLLDVIVARANYWIYIVLMMIGFWGIIVKKNLVKKIVSMNILQTAVILFYVSIGAKRDATLPIIEHGHHGAHTAVTASHYINPLPHVLMLTAIVVSVATLGVALALVIRIHKQYHTLEENEIVKKIREE
ncbi:MAG: NADH-quinone oxidoreductase subunit J [Chloroflexi bacterium]|nr:MAG: NADH-quinone oxidoreductase subunit J [Chloroflexota bacterium]